MVDDPIYLHVILNPLPIYGLAVGLLTWILALIFRSTAAQNIALAVIIVACVSSWPVFHYGEEGHAKIWDISDDAGQQWIDVHMKRANKGIYVFFGTALLAGATLVAGWKFPKAKTSLVIATLLAVVATLAAGAWIAEAGGKIRHPEFRENASPPATTPAPAKHKHAH